MRPNPNPNANPPRSVRLLLSAGILALLLTGAPLAAQADEPAPVQPTAASAPPEALPFAEGPVTPVPDDAPTGVASTDSASTDYERAATSPDATSPATPAEPVAAAEEPPTEEAVVDAAPVPAPASESSRADAAEERVMAAPVIATTALPAATVGTPYRFQVVATGDALTFSARGLPLGMGIGLVDGIITGTPTAPGQHTVLVEVDDAGGQTATKELFLRVDPAAIPVISTASLPDARVGVAYAFQVVASGDGLDYSARGLPRGLDIDSATGRITGTSVSPGVATVVLQVDDALGQTATKQIVMQVLPAAAPTITTTALPPATVGKMYSFPVVATGDGLEYSALGLPRGLGINPATGFITGTATSTGSVTVVLQVDDAYGQIATKQLILRVDAAAVPVITTAALPTGTVGAAYRFQVVATGDGLRYSALGLAGGLRIDRTTGIISGTPIAAGRVIVVLQVDDALGQTATKQVQLKVDPAALPTITTGSLPDATVGAAFRFPVAATGGGLTYSALGLPRGLGIDSVTGIISGVPTTAGPASVVLQVTDALGQTATKQVELRVKTAVVPPLAPPVFTSAPPAEGAVGAVGSRFSYTPTVVSDTPVTFALDGSVPGLVFDPATGTLAGVPTASGSYPLKITATNGAPEAATVSFTLAVSPAAGPTPSQGPPSVSANPGISSAAPAAHGPAKPWTGNASSVLAETGASASRLVETIAGLLLLAAGAVIVTKRRRRNVIARR